LNVVIIKTKMIGEVTPTVAENTLVSVEDAESAEDTKGV